jgi:hypothetical protein
MGGSSHTTETALAGVQVQTSLLGQPIPIGWGRARLSCNLIDYVGFKAIPQTTKTGGKGGSTSTTYTYSAWPILALCEGPIQGIRTVYKDSSVLTLSASKLSLAVGSLTQTPWAAMTSLYPSHALAYPGLSYVYAQDYPLGSGASLSNHAFEIDFAIQTTAVTTGDANASDIVQDFLTNPNYGVTGWASGLIDATSFADFATYTRAAGLFLSPILDQAKTGADFLTQIGLQTNSEFIFSEGVLKARPYGDTTITGNGATWTAAISPVFDINEDSLLDEVTLEIVDQTDAYNYVQVEYLDRANQYQPAVAVAQDLDNIVTFGLRKRDPEQFHDICDAGIAQKVVQLRLQRALYVRDIYTFTLPEDFVALEPMDYITLTTTVDGLALNRKLVLIQQIDENGDGTLSITATGVPGSTATAALYTSHSSSGFQPAVDVAPPSVSSPVIFDAPLGIANSGANEVWIAASGGTAANWGGCNVWLSVDNATFQNVGQITAPARYGTLTAALASHADPDSANTLSVDLTASGGVLNTSTNASADAGSTPCLIDKEVVDYGTATLTSAYHYNLTYLRRGQKSTAIASHANGSAFVRLDGAVFRYSLPQSVIGHTLYIKLQSFNQYGRAAQDLSTLTAITFTPAPGATSTLAIGSIPGSVPSDSFTYTSTTTSVSISWPAMTIYRIDGTTMAVSSGNQTITGLTASTTYQIYPFVTDYGLSSGTMSFAAGAYGTPAIASASSGSPAAIAQTYLRINIPLNSFAVATTASGTGGGGGGGFAGGNGFK